MGTSILTKAADSSINLNPGFAKQKKPAVYSAFASSFSNVDNSVNQATYCQLIMLPFKFSAIRIGWPHMGGNGALSGLNMVIAATDNVGDLTYTNTANCKKFITPMRAGVEKNTLSSDGWQAVTWAGAATGSASDLGADKIDVAWSDMIACDAVALADDHSGRFAGWYALLVRVYPGAGYYTRCSFAGFSDTTKYLTDTGADIVLGANRGGGDHVTTLSNWAQSSTPSFSDSAVMPLIVEAWGERQPSALFTGDSRFASAPTAESTTAYRTLMRKVEQAAIADGNKLRVLRSSQGGKTTAIYSGRVSKILEHLPDTDVSVYLAYSINDGSPTAALLSAAKNRLLQHIEKCIASNIRPVIVTIFPTTGGYGSNMSAVTDFETFCSNLGFPVISPLQLYGGATGDWTGSWNEDANHMTAAGYTDLAGRIYTLIKPYLS